MRRLFTTGRRSTARRLLRAIPLALAVGLAVLTVLLIAGTARGYRRPYRVWFEAHDAYGLWFDDGTLQVFRGRNWKLDYNNAHDGIPTARTIPWSAPPELDVMRGVTVPDANQALTNRVILSRWPPLWNTGSVGFASTDIVVDEVSIAGFDVGRWVYVRAASAWLVITIVAAYAAVYLAIRTRRRRRFAPGSCIGCGYDLRATPERCPECGRVA